MLVIIFMMSGCSIQGWKYTSEPKIYQKPISNLNLVVPTLQDSRDSNNSLGALWAFIPLVPFATSELNTPESAAQYRGLLKPNEDFAKAIAEEIDNASIFKTASFNYGRTNGDLYLVGTLKKGQVKPTMVTYGLSCYGSLLWYLGLPAEKRRNNIEIEFKLIDENYNVYFTKNYKATEEFWAGLYYDAGKLGMEEALKKLSIELVNDLRNIVPELKFKNK